MPVQTLPLPMDLTVYAGTTFRRQLRWLPDGTAPQNFTGWTARWLIGPEHGTAITAITTADPDLILTDTGLITLTLAADDTAALPAGLLWYNLDLTAPGGTPVIRFIRGRFAVIHDVEPGA